MTEIAQRADFSGIRYAQCWEDADVLRAALQIQPGDVCLSIASAGDNSLALLLDDPSEVVAVDLSVSQLHCVALRIAAYRCLQHHELLQLLGSRRTSGAQRMSLYRRCRTALADAPRQFWDQRLPYVVAGIGAAGKFERYFTLFRRWVMPLIHRQTTVDRLLSYRPSLARSRFYDQRWNSVVWRMLFKVFFGRQVMGAAGRDPDFFRYVDSDVGNSILRRTRHALRHNDPANNPYLHWILRGYHGTALPLALRESSFDVIRQRLGRVRLVQGSLEDTLANMPIVNRCNLSDIFEYMSHDVSQSLLRFIATKLAAQGRMVYWNMLVPRSASADLDDLLQSYDTEAKMLHHHDQAWFYQRLVIEERR